MAEQEERRRDPSPPEGGLSLLDGVSPVASTLPADMAEQRLVAADKDRPLAERLAAFEDIAETEVGDTSLSRARNLERSTGLRQILLKFEGGQSLRDAEGPHRLRPGRRTRCGAATIR
jgi:hypothetical protein